tara:strand:+ start:823 stop:942 length:120 start_codon:yes stop_codon:yes gene_type:complete
MVVVLIFIISIHFFKKNDQLEEFSNWSLDIKIKFKLTND